MTESKKSKPTEKSKNGAKSRKSPTKHGGMTNKELEHQYKLSLMRECMVYGKDYRETKSYFNDRGFTLGKTQFTELRTELRGVKSARNWFSSEALYMLEQDHMISVERIRKYEDKLVNISNRLIEEDDFETSVNYDTDKSGIVKLRVRNYNTELFLKIISEFKSIQETKTKMFSATPLVQEMMEVHRQQEAEKDIVTQPAKTEKEIKNV